MFLEVLHVDQFIFMSCSSFQALYSYVPQNDDELELREGDLVSVMEKCDDGWFVGMCLGTDSSVVQSHTPTVTSIHIEFLQRGSKLLYACNVLLEK